MTSKLSAVLWSAGGLLVTLLIAWYFSRNNNGAGTAATTGSSETPPSVSFGGATISPVTVTGGGGTAAGNGACCQRCGDSTSQSAGKILQSGDFTQNVNTATHALVTNGTLVTPATAGTPQGIMLIPQQNGGMPLPAESWWTNDTLYRQAYVISYNQTVGQLAQMLMQQKRPAISQMPMSYANSNSAAAAENLAAKDGATQLARGGHDTRWLTEAQSNSMLMMNTMQSTLNQWLMKLGDRNVGGSNFAAPPDQNVSQYLIN